MKIQFFIHSFLVALWNSLPEVPMCLHSFYRISAHDHVVVVPSLASLRKSSPNKLFRTDQPAWQKSAEHFNCCPLKVQSCSAMIRHPEIHLQRILIPLIHWMLLLMWWKIKWALTKPWEQNSAVSNGNPIKILSMYLFLNIHAIEPFPLNA